MMSQPRLGASSRRPVFLHIATTGFDGELALPLSPVHRTPRPCFARAAFQAVQRTVSVYDASQILAWIAKDSREPHERVDRVLQIPESQCRCCSDESWNPGDVRAKHRLCHGPGRALSASRAIGIAAQRLRGHRQLASEAPQVLSPRHQHLATEDFHDQFPVVRGPESQGHSCRLSRRGVAVSGARFEARSTVPHAL